MAFWIAVLRTKRGWNYGDEIRKLPPKFYGPSRSSTTPTCVNSISPMSKLSDQHAGSHDIVGGSHCWHHLLCHDFSFGDHFMVFKKSSPRGMKLSVFELSRKKHDIRAANGPRPLRSSGLPCGWSIAHLSLSMDLFQYSMDLFQYSQCLYLCASFSNEQFDIK